MTGTTGLSGISVRGLLVSRRHILRLLLVFSFAPTCLFAQTMDEFPAWAARVKALEAEVTALRHADSQPEQPEGYMLSAVGVGDFLTAGDPLVAAISSKYPSVKVTGFFQADAGWVHQDAAKRLAVGDAQDGADFRRARLAATGDVAENVGYMVEFDFGFPDRPNFMDVWLEVRDTHLLNNLKIGQFRHPFGPDGLTSVKELTFIERGLPFAFLPFRQIGAMIAAADVFVDVSARDTLSVDDVKSMADEAIVFALANPDPEITPEAAAGHVRVMATGRSDYPNQINNVLCFRDCSEAFWMSGLATSISK